jgi:hypothetical protein
MSKDKTLRDCIAVYVSIQNVVVVEVDRYGVVLVTLSLSRTESDMCTGCMQHAVGLTLNFRYCYSACMPQRVSHLPACLSIPCRERERERVMYGAVLHWSGRRWREQEEKRGGAEREE